MKINYTFLGVILTLLVSCNWGEKYFDLDSSQWFVYDVDDTLVFKSDQSTYDTFIVGSIINAYERIDDYRFNFFWVEYDGVGECNNCPLEGFRRSMGLFDESVTIYGQFNSVFFYFAETSPWPYVLGDTVIRNVYIEREIPVKDSINDKVRAIFYSHDFGVIRYDMHDGRVYKLQIK